MITDFKNKIRSTKICSAARPEGPKLQAQGLSAALGWGQRTPPHQLGAPGKRCKLWQWGLLEKPSRQEFWCYLNITVKLVWCQTMCWKQRLWNHFKKLFSCRIFMSPCSGPSRARGLRSVNRRNLRFLSHWVCQPVIVLLLRYSYKNVNDKQLLII